eukprot:GILJ01009140.1.p1 GENE.GILJ01009140.1~~GILJ01009140.1.p1  ORF type:complete len:641 (-),score=104.64 GILJ01009140.1:295-2178(-)
MAAPAPSPLPFDAPSEPNQEKGPDIVVLHPGSLYLRYGFASDLSPAVIPNVIAYQLRDPSSRQIIVPAPTYASSSSVSTSAQTDGTTHDPSVEAFEREVSAVEADIRRRRYLRSNKGMLKKGLPAAFPRYQGTWYDSSNATQQLQNINQSQVDVSKPFLVGEEALQLQQQQPFKVVWPFRRGYLNTSAANQMPGEDTKPLQSVADDVERIFEYVLITKMGLSRKDIRGLHCVLVLPDMLNRDEIKTLVNVILRQLGFKACFLHQESVLACFGAGVSTACVVDIGAQKTNVVCVDDGIMLPSTCVHMDYGGDDMDRFLLKLLTQTSTHFFPYPECNPNDLQDASILRRMKESLCSCVQLDELVFPYEFKTHKIDQPTTVYRFNISDNAVIAAHGFLYPSMLDVRPLSLLHFRSLYQFQDPEDYIEDLLAAEQKPQPKPEAKDNQAAPVPEVQTASVTVQPPKQRTNFVRTGLETATTAILPLDEAIAVSLSNASTPELRKKLCMSILVVGGGALLPSLQPVLEERLKERIARIDPNIDAVQVWVNPKDSDPRFLSWVGGSVIPRFDSAKDQWLWRSRWLGEWDPAEARDELRQEETVEAKTEAARKWRKDRPLEGGVRFIRERAPIAW